MLPRHTKHSHLRRVNYGAVVVVTVTVMDLKRVSHVYLFCRLFMCDFCFVFFFSFYSLLFLPLHLIQAKISMEKSSFFIVNAMQLMWKCFQLAIVNIHRNQFDTFDGVWHILYTFMYCFSMFSFVSLSLFITFHTKMYGFLQVISASVVYVSLACKKEDELLNVTNGIYFFSVFFVYLLCSVMSLWSTSFIY